MMRNLFVTRTILAICLAAFAGCSGESLPDTVPVTGTVSYQGKPLGGASVVLVSSDTSVKPARGTTDGSGKFSVRTYLNSTNDVEGAVPGDYAVLVIKKDEPDLSEFENLSETELMEMSDAGKIPQPKHLLPVKYASPTTTEFETTVAADQTNELTLELTD